MRYYSYIKFWQNRVNRASKKAKVRRADRKKVSAFPIRCNALTASQTYRCDFSWNSIGIANAYVHIRVLCSPLQRKNNFVSDLSLKRLKWLNADRRMISESHGNTKHTGNEDSATIISRFWTINFIENHEIHVFIDRVDASRWSYVGCLCASGRKLFFAPPIQFNCSAHAFHLIIA